MQQYPPGYGCTNGQPILDPTIAMLVQQLQQMQQLWAMATKKNEQEYIREEAYSEVAPPFVSMI